MLLGGNLPDLFQTDSIGLWFAALVKSELLHNLLGQVTPAAFGKDGSLGVQLHATCKGVLGSSALGNAHIVGGNALDTAILVEEHLGGSTAGIDLHAQRLRLISKPLDQVAQANYVVAMVVHGPALKDRNGDAAGSGEEGESILGHGCV